MDLINRFFGSALQPGHAAPNFELVDQNGQKQSLSAYRGRWVILYFYPKDETYFCTKEACSFRDSQADFAGLNAQVLGVSVDDEAAHKKFSDKEKLNFPLLADTAKNVSKSYGVLMPVGISNRVTFLIDPHAKIAAVIEWANWFSYGRKVADRLRELQAKAT